MFAAIVYFPHTNVDLYMLFDICVYFTGKENIEEEHNLLPGRVCNRAVVVVVVIVVVVVLVVIAVVIVIVAVVVVVCSM